MWKNLPLKNFVYISFGLSLITTIFIVLIKNFLPPVVPLFYGLPTGSGQLTTSQGLLLAPLTSLIITCINIGLTQFTKELFLKKTLIISSTFVSVLITITVVKIVLLVGFF